MPDLPISTDLDLRARYSQGGGIYRIMPRAVAHPTEPEELHAAIAYAVDRGLTLIPRGAGSAMGGSNVGDGLIVDLAAYFPGDLEDTGPMPDDPTASATPSTTFAALNQFLAAGHLRVPPEPSSGAWATLGGMVSTNASGARSVRYGSIRPWVDDVYLLTAEGGLDLGRGRAPDPRHPVVKRWREDAEPLIRRHADLIRARYPKVTKNSAGYALDQYLASGDLLDIVVGSEGTLGIVSDVILRVDAIPAYRGSVRAVLGARADLVGAMAAIRAHNPSTLEFLDASFLRVVGGEFKDAAGVLLADIEGDDFDDMWQRGAAAVRAVQRDVRDARLAIDANEIEHLWRIRHGASPVLAALSDGRQSLQVIEDGCVPPARLADYLDAVDTACRAAEMDVVMFGHAGDGHVHVNLLPNLGRTDWLERVRTIFDVVSSAVIALGGTPSGEHGAGRLRAGLLEQLYGPEVIECFRAVKRAFDPTGLFNPGVILSDGVDPLSRLKVGSDAASLPPGTAAYLKEIETSANWGKSRYF